MNVPNISVFDYNAEMAMKYVCKNRHGYIKELKPFGKDVINSLKAAGFLKTGWATDGETFGATDFLAKYLKVILGEKQFDKIFKKTTSST